MTDRVPNKETPELQLVPIDSIRNFIREKLRDYPAFPVLTAILCAILPGVLTENVSWRSTLLPAVLVLTGWYLLGAGAAFFRVALPALAGLLALIWNLNIRQNDSLFRLLHTRMTAGVEAEIRICDPSLYHDGTFSPSIRRVLCRVTAVRFSPSDRWTATDSPVIAVLPAEIADELAWGDRFRAVGQLNRPEVRRFAGGFDYGEYLLRRRIHFTLSVFRLQRIGRQSSWYGRLLAGRDRLLRSLTGPLKTPEERALAAGLLFGCRQRIVPEAKAAYIRSGTVHILTVSGLHVGMFAAAVFLLLLPVPFRWRMILAPMLTLVYAFSTGMQLPAMRAVVMLFCWCIPRAFMLRGNSLNSLFLAGSLLLVWNPFQLTDPGFQYSFCCVFFLLLSAGRTSEWMQLTTEKQQWIPFRKQSRSARLGRRLLTRFCAVTAGCVTAWLCASVLTVYYQGLALPFAPAANLLIVPAVYLVFVLFTVAVLPCLICPLLGKLFALLLGIPLAVIEPVCRFFAELSDGRIPAAPGWSVFAGIAMLLLLFGFFGRKASVAGAAGMILLLFFWCGAPPCAETELLLLYGGQQRLPALVWSAPAENFSAAVNLSDFRQTVAAADYLKRRGHSDLTLLVSPGAAREQTYGAQYFPKLMRVRNYLASVPTARTETARKAKQQAELSGARLFLQPGKSLRWHSGGQKLETFAKNGEFSFDIWQKEHTVRVRMVSGPAALSVRIWNGSGPEKEYFLPRDRVPGMLRITLNQGKAGDGT